jgi:hypothetical protein
MKSQPAKLGDRAGKPESERSLSKTRICRPFHGLGVGDASLTWGSAVLHPRLYADASFAG